MTSPDRTLLIAEIREPPSFSEEATRVPEKQQFVSPDLLCGHGISIKYYAIKGTNTKALLQIVGSKRTPADAEILPKAINDHELT